MNAASLFAVGVSVWLTAVPAASESGAALALSCWNCHGPGGERSGEIPPISGLGAAEIAASLRAFRSGETEGTIMSRIAKGYTDAEIDALSDYLAAVPVDRRP